MPYAASPLSQWPAVPMAERDKPEVWRQRAVELRALSAQTKDEISRQTLIELADTWDEMAERVERRFGGDVSRLKTH